MSGNLSAGTVSIGVKPDSAGFGTSLKEQITGHTKGIGQHMGGIIKEGLSTMAGPIAAVTAAFGVEKLVEGSISSFENLAGSVRTMQRTMGGSVETVSALRGAMQLSGLNMDTAGSAMNRFEKAVGTAGKTSGDAAKMSQLLGVSILDASGHVKNMADILPSVADKFKEMPDGTEKTALAMQLFGKSGTQMLPFLNKGSEGMKELEGKAKSMGLVLDDTSMNSFANSKKVQREFQATLQGLSVTLGEVLLPVMEALEGTMKEVLIPVVQKITAFVHAHRESFEQLATSIKSLLLPILDATIEVIGAVTKWILDNKTMVLGLIVVIGSAVAAFTAYKLITEGITLAQQAYATIQAIVKGATIASTLAQMGLNTALLANPIGLVIAAVAALVAGLIWFFTQTKLGQQVWATFTKFLTETMHNLGQFFGTVWTGIQTAFSAAFGFIGAAFKGYINIWIGLIDTFIGAINGALSLLKTVTGGSINLKVPTIPKLASGGVVPATPGGRLVTVAEAGEPEAIIPLSKLGSVAGGGSGMTIKYYAAKNDSISSEQKLVDAVQRARVLGWT